MLDKWGHWRCSDRGQRDPRAGRGQNMFWRLSLLTMVRLADWANAGLTHAAQLANARTSAKTFILIRSLAVKCKSWPSNMCPPLRSVPQTPATTITRLEVLGHPHRPGSFGVARTSPAGAVAGRANGAEGRGGGISAILPIGPYFRFRCTWYLSTISTVTRANMQNPQPTTAICKIHSSTGSISARRSELPMYGDFLQ